MEHETDLSALDRNTLRTWRAMNLIGWGAASMIANALLLVTLTIALVGRLGVLLPSPFRWVLAGIALGLAGAGAGTVVAANVYRSPGLVAGLAAGVLGVIVGLLLLPVGFMGTWAVFWAASIPSIPNIACAAFVARHRWAKRPSALRSPA